jgi:hypothetical protein
MATNAPAKMADQDAADFEITPGVLPTAPGVLASDTSSIALPYFKLSNVGAHRQQQNDWDRHAQQPQQDSATHDD